MLPAPPPPLLLNVPLPVTQRKPCSPRRVNPPRPMSPLFPPLPPLTSLPTPVLWDLDDLGW